MARTSMATPSTSHACLRYGQDTVFCIKRQQGKLGGCRPQAHRVRLRSVVLLTAGFQGKPCHGTGQRPHSHFRIRYPTPGATRITSRSSRDLPT